MPKKKIGVRFLVLAALLGIAAWLPLSSFGRRSGEAAQVAGETGAGRLVVLDRMMGLPFEGEKLRVRATPAPVASRSLSRERQHYPALTLKGRRTKVVWPVDLGRAERLEFGYFASGPAGRQAEVEFALREDGGTVDLFKVRKTLDDFKKGVIETTTNLRGMTGRTNLLFTTQVVRGQADGLQVSWASPRIVGRPSRSERIGNPRNVLVICVDTLRADRLKVFGGGSDTVMPNLEKRIRSGAVAFPQAYTNAPWSLPSMASLLTGRVPGQHFAGFRVKVGGSKTQFDLLPRPTRGGIELVINNLRYRYQMLHPSIATLQEILGSRGYATGALHHNGYINNPTRVLKGTDHFTHYIAPDAALATNLGLSWLKAHRDKRSFLYLHYMDPHGWLEKTQRLHPNIKAENYREELKPKYMEAYDSLVRYADLHLERLFAGLEAAGILNDTYVVLFADHGEFFFENGAGVGHGDALFEPVLRVPLAIWGPDLKPAILPTRVSLADVVPTLLDLLRVEDSPAGFSGRSLLPVMAGKETKDRSFFSEFSLGGPDAVALYEGDWKMIYDLKTRQHSFYNLKQDPTETWDVAGRQPRLERMFRARIREHQAESGKLFRSLKYGETSLDRETIESLRALGYIQ